MVLKVFIRGLGNLAFPLPAHWNHTRTKCKIALIYPQLINPTCFHGDRFKSIKQFMAVCWFLRVRIILAE